MWEIQFVMDGSHETAYLSQIHVDYIYPDHFIFQQNQDTECNLREVPKFAIVARQQNNLGSHFSSSQVLGNVSV